MTNTLYTLIGLSYLFISVWLSFVLGERLARGPNRMDKEIGITFALLIFFIVIPFPVLIDLGYL
jgi:hypothetical protein